MNASGAKLFVSRQTVLPDGVKAAVLLVKNGKIEAIHPCANDNEINDKLGQHSNVEYEDFGNLLLMPGIVDSHVHVNEPGRSEWEGFWTATKAAAAGGVTTIVDMPLNSIPPTTTVENLKTKAQVARTKAFVDIGFWGGVIPGNQKDLKPLVEAGVVGFKCFLCPSCIEEFPHVNEEDVEKALMELRNLNTVLAFHAECELKDAIDKSKEDPSVYHTYLQTRPEIMEVNAITIITKLCKAYNVRCHIVHLSAAEALGLVREAKKNKLRLTAETCYHYLYLTAEKIPRNATQFKCCPPIRDESNRVSKFIFNLQFAKLQTLV
ncbi:allantoinase [Nasonia vitripennis]|uniref:Amidohydrolase-related domain-containing protein n=1 Tax=Nasonia vitripennis TaxID=7425 RepID=A0A7M7QZT6_NASVI|nr:allantoinase [Nasonia vitripennis]